VGHESAPLEFTPHAFYGWQNRFDDPRHEYRTIYAAEERITAIREVVQDLRPNTRVRAELRALGAKEGEFVVAGSVPWKWRLERVLAPANLITTDEVIDLTDPGVRASLEGEHAELLNRYGMKHLDVSDITSKTRIVTQTLSRSLFESGASGIRFPSNTDNRPCVVLFESRGSLTANGPTESLSGPVPELLTVCSEWELVLREHDLPGYAVRAENRRSRVKSWLLRFLGR